MWLFANFPESGLAAGREDGGACSPDIVAMPPLPIWGPWLATVALPHRLPPAECMTATMRNVIGRNSHQIHTKIRSRRSCRSALKLAVSQQMVRWLLALVLVAATTLPLWAAATALVGGAITAPCALR